LIARGVWLVRQGIRTPLPPKDFQIEAKMSFGNLMTGVLAIPSDENERE